MAGVGVWAKGARHPMLGRPPICLNCLLTSYKCKIHIMMIYGSIREADAGDDPEKRHKVILDSFTSHARQCIALQ
jgi:hypothetical protein